MHHCVCTSNTNNQKLTLIKLLMVRDSESSDSCIPNEESNLIGASNAKCLSVEGVFVLLDCISSRVHKFGDLFFIMLNLWSKRFYDLLLTPGVDHK